MIKPIEIPLTLDIAKPNRIKVISLRQGEVRSTELIITLVCNGDRLTLSDYDEVMFFADKSDGCIAEACTIASDGMARYKLPPAMATSAETIKLAYLQLKKGSDWIATTQCITFEVAAGIKMRDAPTTYIPMFDELKAEFESLVQDAKDQLASQSSEFATLKSDSQAATTSANTAATKADAATSASTTQTAACAAATNAAMAVATTALSKRRADTLYANALIGSAQGDMVHVEDAWEADAVGLRVMGKSAQLTTVGKNLLAVRLPSKINAGITYSKNSDGSITLSGTATSDAYFRIDQADGSGSNLANYSGTYTLSGGGTGPIMRLMRASDLASIIDVRSATPTTKTFTEVNCFFDIAVPKGTTVNATYYPQLELGSVATHYEPYTGGKPAPSPEYPQEVDVVDSPVTVQVVGKNLLDLSPQNIDNKLYSTYLGDGWWRLEPSSGVFANVFARVKAQIKPSTKYYVVVEVKNSNGGNIAIMSGAPGGQCQFETLTVSAAPNTVSVHDVLSVDADLMTSAVYSMRAFIIGNTDVSRLVEFRASIFPTHEEAIGFVYEPYTSIQQTITLPSDHNYLASLPDGTRDELVLRSDGVAVLTECVGARVFNGSETWGCDPSLSYPFRLSDPVLGADYQQLMCDSYIVRKFEITYEMQGVTASAVSAPNKFCFRDTTIAQTVDAWKVKLAASNVSIYYKLAVPTTRYSADNGATWSTTDPAAGQSTIPLHKGTNNVWCTDPLSPEVGLDYVQDTNKVINELRAAIVASGATS